MIYAVELGGPEGPLDGDSDAWCFPEKRALQVGLARMAYAMADIYIMDDPLSAVDPAVGRELFSSVVCGRLAGSTRLLVTHQVIGVDCFPKLIRCLILAVMLYGKCKTGSRGCLSFIFPGVASKRVCQHKKKNRRLTNEHCQRPLLSDSSIGARFWDISVHDYLRTRHVFQSSIITIFLNARLPL